MNQMPNAMLPITGTWVPVSFREGKTKERPPHGKFTAYYVTFATQDGSFQVEDTYWQRKEGNHPEINKPLFGTISEGEYGPRFKMEQQDAQQSIQRDMSGGMTVPPTGQTAEVQGMANVQAATTAQPPIALRADPDAERQRKIMRQHSQEMALRLIDASRDAGDLDLSDKAMVQSYLNEIVRPLTDWFMKDLGA